MSLKATWFRDKIKKKSKKGFQGFPIATVTFYGRDNNHASKVAVGIVMDDSGEVTIIERWFSQERDVRLDVSVNEAIVKFIEKHGAKTVVSPNRILGCPHEEGVDYPEGEKCPQCTYWASRDRYTGEIIQ